MIVLHYTGIMGKNRGLVLRVASILHVLFHVGSDEANPNISNEISNRAIRAAINLVQLTCQQTTFMIGKGQLEEELQKNQRIVEASEFVTVNCSDLATLLDQIQNHC